MDKELIKKAFADAEKDQQEKQIAEIKRIVKTSLERIEEKSKAKNDIEEEIRVLRKDLDDLKAGRLDLIEERQIKDVKAREISVIIVKRIEKEYVPYYPWRSPWVVQLKQPTWSNGTTYTVTNTSGMQYLSTDDVMFASTWDPMTTLTVTGQTFSNFAKGAYDIGGHIINL